MACVYHTHMWYAYIMYDASNAYYCTYIHEASHTYMYVIFNVCILNKCTPCRSHVTHVVMHITVLRLQHTLKNTIIKLN